MAVINKNNAHMEFPLQIRRQYAGPIEFTEIWYDLEEAKQYAKTGATAYAGQTIKVVNEQTKTVTTYTIQIDGSLRTVGEEKHTHTVDEVTETANKKYVTPTDKTRWDDKFTKNETTEHIKTAKDEVLNRITEIENGRVWKPSVNTFSDIAKTYPTPKDTWCVITKDTNIIWMYEESKNQWIDLGHSVIHDNATESKDGLMSKEDKKKLNDLNTTLSSLETKITERHNTDKQALDEAIKNVDDKIVFATDEEIEEFLNPELLTEVFELANEQDIKLLFQGTLLENATTYNLQTLSLDEAKMVNMKLLSLYNDLIKQEINKKINKTTTLKLGKGLVGSSDFSKDTVSISLNIATDEEIDQMFTQGGF